MTTHNEFTVDADLPVAQLREAYASREFWQWRDATVEELSGTLVRVTEPVDPSLLPGGVARLVGQQLQVRRTLTLGEDAGDALPISYEMDVAPAPARVTGTATARVRAGGAETSVEFHNDVTVQVPFVGPAIEQQIAGELEAIFRAELDAVTQWAGGVHDA